MGLGNNGETPPLQALLRNGIAICPLFNVYNTSKYVCSCSRSSCAFRHSPCTILAKQMATKSPGLLSRSRCFIARWVAGTYTLFSLD